MNDSQFSRTNSESCSEEPINTAGHPFHPLSELFPLLDGDALNDLAEDIRRHGLREPIVLHGGLILDGRNRYHACQLAGIEPRYREFDGSDPVAQVVSANLHRRHLDESERAMVAEKLANMRQGERTDLEPSANLPKVSQREAANRLHVSERSVRSAAYVRNHGAPDLVRAVERGDIPVSRAAKIARKPIEQQKRETRSPAATTRSRRKPAEERVPELNSVSWSQATLEARARFVDAVGGLEPFWEVARPDLREPFIERRRREWERHITPSNSRRQIDPSEQRDPPEMPEFLGRESSEAVGPAGNANTTNLEQGSKPSQST